MGPNFLALWRGHAGGMDITLTYSYATSNIYLYIDHMI